MRMVNKIHCKIHKDGYAIKKGEDCWVRYSRDAEYLFIYRHKNDGIMNFAMMISVDSAPNWLELYRG